MATAKEEEAYLDPPKFSESSLIICMGQSQSGKSTFVKVRIFGYELISVFIEYCFC